MTTTQMVADPSKTDMRAPDVAKTETVKLKFFRTLEYGEDKYAEGNTYEVAKEKARAILALKTEGPYNYFGSRNADEATRHMLKYAEVVKDPEDLL